MPLQPCQAPHLLLCCRQLSRETSTPVGLTLWAPMCAHGNLNSATTHCSAHRNALLAGPLSHTP